MTGGIGAWAIRVLPIRNGTSGNIVRNPCASATLVQLAFSAA
jgi:hypothetical protein